jgi:hypothetical protein
LLGNKAEHRQQMADLRFSTTIYQPVKGQGHDKVTEKK